MKLKENLKNLLKPNTERVLALFILEFGFTFIFLALSDKMPPWTILFIAPNLVYLQTTINPLAISQAELSIHGAISDLLSVFYIYLLACIIVRIYEIYKNKKVEK